MVIMRRAMVNRRNSVNERRKHRETVGWGYFVLEGQAHPDRRKSINDRRHTENY